MITRVERRSYWKGRYETENQTKTPNQQRILGRSRPCSRRAAKVARKTARMHGTPIYIWEDGEVVAEKP